LAAFAALVLLLAFGDRIGPIHDSRAPALSVAGTGFKVALAERTIVRILQTVSGVES